MKGKYFWSLMVLATLFSLSLSVAACGDDDDDDDDNDVADDDAVDDDAADDDDDDNNDNDNDNDNNDDNDDTTPLFTEDFESYTAEEPLGSPWVVTLSGDSASTIYPAADETYGNCLENIGSSLEGEGVKAVLNFTGVEEDIFVTFEVWDDIPAYGRFWLSSDGGATPGPGIATVPGGTLYVKTAGGFDVTCGAVVPGDWNLISLFVDYAAGTYSVEINGVMECEDVDAGLGADVTYNAIVLDDSTVASEGGYYYFDNILGTTL